MNAHTQRFTVAGPAGALACALDLPEDGVAPRGLALVCHPHPVYGGTMDNKVVQTVARAALQCGWRSLRFNFRGIGGSEGAWDEGRGEIDDALAVVLAQRRADEPLLLAGFSFGGYVASRVAKLLAESGSPAEQVVLIAPATGNFPVALVPADTLVVHGDADDVVPLSATLAWALPQTLPIVVVPGVGHFFHGQLPLLKSLVVRHLERR